MAKEAFNRKRSIFCGPLEKELRKRLNSGRQHSVKWVKGIRSNIKCTVVQQAERNRAYPPAATVHHSAVSYPRGDPFSPMLFNLLTQDVIQEVAKGEITMTLYVEDMVMLTKSKQALHKELDRLHNWSWKNGLDINTRNPASNITYSYAKQGGYESKLDNFTCSNNNLELVNSYKYLGLTLQVPKNAFSEHIEERCMAVTKAIYDKE
ncbi:hypothetical protein ANN_22413 [Periplaneta americana]|uniref:Reverse transcriptase domain-containing protein n=1 Tax=Periplaneta americana TaxID=6978 RepID=A0ABQ8S8C1_PERAM|nr:hypothetical protein ANN_22413 [Periplaneta americana]